MLLLQTAALAEDPEISAEVATYNEAMLRFTAAFADATPKLAECAAPAAEQMLAYFDRQTGAIRINAADGPVVDAPCIAAVFRSVVDASSGGIGREIAVLVVTKPVLRFDGEALILGVVEKSEIVSRIELQMPHIRQCYSGGLVARPTMGGAFVVRFVIQPDGRVQTPAVERSALAEPETEACILREFGRITFPAPAGGGIVVVKYPLVFQPG